MSGEIGDIERTHYALEHGGAGSRTRSTPADEMTHRTTGSSAYVLQWSVSGCRRADINGPDELRKQLGAGKGATEQRLFVVHGLPKDLVNVIRDVVNIDPAFLEAHKGRRRYRPLRWRKDADFAHFNHPELVRGIYRSWRGLENEANQENSQNDDIHDPMEDPVERAVAGRGDMAAVFCHASLWITKEADVLFLDRLIWERSDSSIRKVGRTALTSNGSTLELNDPTKLSGGNTQTSGVDHEGVSLEDVLFETLKDAPNNGDALMGVFKEIVHDQWLEFFDVLDPTAQHTPPRAAILLWQVQKSLEQNADMSKYLARLGRDTAVTLSDWNSLLERLRVRIDISSLMPRQLPPVPPIARFPESSNGTRQDTLVSSETGGTVAKNAPLGLTKDDNQRSLDRISYIGGFFIPLPIISGILSMGDTFGPTGSLFYVFWAISVPLSVVIVLIIYADTIRKAEIWVEIAAEQVAAATEETVDGKSFNVVPVRVDTIKQEETLTWLPNGRRRRQRTAPSQPVPLQAINYSVGEEEEIIGLPTPAAPETAPPPLPSEPTTGTDLPEFLDIGPGPRIILERPSDGSKAKAWKRQQLGWTGAVKAIVGYRRPRRADDIPLGVVAFEKPNKRKMTTL